MRRQVEQYLAETDWDAWAQVKDFASEADDNAVYDRTLQTVRKMKREGCGLKEI